MYYNAIVSFMTQMTSRDVIPTTEEFRYALIHNVLYRKHSLCSFLLTGIENQGKEKIITDNLTVEHVLPQNKNLSTEWQKMLGDNWEYQRDTWLHILENLTLKDCILTDGAVVLDPCAGSFSTLKSAIAAETKLTFVGTDLQPHVDEQLQMLLLSLE